MKYELIIGSDPGSINIPEGIIHTIDFEIFQKDKGATDRSDQLFNSLKVTGEIKRESKKQTLEILEWSKKTEVNEIYKTVSIKIQTNEDTIRDYFLKEMFCAGYAEKFSIETEKIGSEGIFILEMKQRKGSIPTIKVEAGD